MQFFLTEIVARVVAIYFFIAVGRFLWQGLATRKTSDVHFDYIDIIFPVPNWVAEAERDTAPFRYWFYIVFQVILLVSFLVVAIFGWWVPNK